jgi:hypothetical protein
MKRSTDEEEWKEINKCIAIYIVICYIIQYFVIAYMVHHDKLRIQLTNEDYMAYTMAFLCAPLLIPFEAVGVVIYFIYVIVGALSDGTIGRMLFQW